MNVEYTVVRLDNATAWSDLTQILGGGEKHPIVNSIIRHLQVIKPKCYIIEGRYIDRDYSADYLRFYAQTFRAHDRHCKRVHFFSDDVTEIFTKSDWMDRFSTIQESFRSSYLGFCVVRPLLNAPIGRTVLTAEVRSYFNMESTVTCRTKIRANLLGVDLEVVGTSFLQQDSRVGACAQVAIWTGARHMHERYNYDWLSVADITRLAAPTTSAEAVSLPAGSDFLTSERMIRAIGEMGFQPLCFSKNQDIGAAILPYVESGIPVVLGLNYGSALGHAVTVIGRVFSRQDAPTNKAIDYVTAFIVHDDQAGPYMLVPKNKEISKKFWSDSEDTINHHFRGEMVGLNIYDNAVFAVALMPVRVFSTAQAAEHTAKDRIHAVLEDMPNIRKNLSGQGIKVNERLMDELEVAYKNEKIVLRTYLTSARGYRRYIARTTASGLLKNILLNIHLPHFTWVTEIFSVDSYNQSSPSMRRIYGHTVLDATSTGRDTNGLLMLHLPGVVTLNDVNAEPEEQEKIVIIENDRLYECREKRFRDRDGRVGNIA